MTHGSPPSARPPDAHRYAVLLAATIVLGLASRRFPRLLPWFLAKSAGDILYATAAYWIVRLLPGRVPTAPAAGIAFLFCVGIEFLKFSSLPWLMAARQAPLGRLIFGVGFHASNLVCYALGVLLAVGVERVSWGKTGA